MSEIANALAKAKERTGQTSAPFLVPGAMSTGVDPARAAAAAAAIKKAKRTQRFWFILIALTLPATIFFIWNSLREPEPEPAVVLTAPGPVLSPVQSTVGVPVYGAETKPNSENAPTSDIQSPAPTKPLPSPRADLMSRIAAFSITAVMPSDPPRVVIEGKVIRVDHAVDSDLTFAGITNGQLIFTDLRGAVYTRRY